jgi:Ca-activated chloride channel homolog
MLLSFTHPQYLFLLLLLPIIILLHFFLLKVKRANAVRFANFEAIARIRGIDLYSKNIIVVSMTVIITVCIILSVSGMVVQRDVISSANSFVIAIDSSQSMEANDILPSRIEVAKNTAREFVEQSPAGTKIAILSFSGNAFIEQSLTEDKSLAERGLDSVELSSIGGTDPAEAITAATNVLALEDGKAVILLSDGRINVGNLDGALEYANKNNVVVHTIGIGTEQGGQTAYGISKIEEESLQAAAYTTNGKYFRVQDEADFAEAFKEILEYKLKKVSFDISREMLLIALGLVFIQYILINTRYKVFP